MAKSTDGSTRLDAGFSDMRSPITPSGLQKTSSSKIYERSVGYLPFAKLLNPTLNSLIMKVVGGQMARDNIRFTEYAESQLQQRIKIERRSSTMEGTSRKDFAHYLLNSRDPQTGKGFEYSELQADIGLLIAAGADTVATTLSATFFYLVHNPHVLSKLTTELRSTFVSTSEIRHGPKLASCKTRTI
ncbi:hypothetical protein W97_07718 [Coniosporium apollinis CBS 100218]|uniref:Cytochrome P450 n=1 Tax=Coniosporium apollinis (strain CBS 100218) TaxID=1168221 RepID=R7Z2Y7_CONA1|nr:uncharacterized protein W97_07718 [Coniosporium apollinis CBS 100218]EON68394.1 hypothetical protein W97_07718 [Coniosporium apollinis CBS 100218]